MQLMYEISFWHWFALGLLLLIIEMAGTGGYLLWIGMAAGFTGAIVLLMPDMIWQFQILIFSVASVLFALGWWQYQVRHPDVAAEPLLNKRSAQYVGRVFTLSDAIDNGRGKIRVDDSFWEVTAAEDIPAGVHVRVVSLEHDQIFRVEKI